MWLFQSKTHAKMSTSTEIYTCRWVGGTHIWNGYGCKGQGAFGDRECVKNRGPVVRECAKLPIKRGILETNLLKFLKNGGLWVKIWQNFLKSRGLWVKIVLNFSQNRGLWVTVVKFLKNMGSLGDSDAENGGLCSLTYASPLKWECPSPRRWV